MKSITFTVPGKPQGKARPRVVRQGGVTRSFTPEKTVLYENWIRTCYQQAAGEYRFPDDAPLELVVTAAFPVPKSFSRRKREGCLSGLIRPTGKPDCDNIAKSVADALNGVAYRDDSRVCKLTVMKKYGEAEGLKVVVREIPWSFEQEDEADGNAGDNPVF